VRNKLSRNEEDLAAGIEFPCKKGDFSTLSWLICDIATQETTLFYRFSHAASEDRSQLFLRIDFHGKLITVTDFDLPADFDP